MAHQLKKLRLKRISLCAFAIWSSLLLSACATSPPDIPICTEITVDRAYCVHTISNKEFYFDDKNKVDGKTYWEARPTMLLVPFTSWVELKSWIIHECKVTGRCDSRISSWDRTLEKVDEIVKEK